MKATHRHFPSFVFVFLPSLSRKTIEFRIMLSFTGCTYSAALTISTQMDNNQLIRCRNLAVVPQGQTHQKNHLMYHSAYLKTTENLIQDIILALYPSDQQISICCRWILCRSICLLTVQRPCTVYPNDYTNV